MSKKKIKFPIVNIYTDGACNPNPGPGGWGAVLLFPGKKPRDLKGAEAVTTNNRMELTAAIEALQSLPRPHKVRLHTDSKYLRQGITEWVERWKQRGWQTIERTAVKNQDLWQALSSLIEEHCVDWKWVKGHAGNKWNERADVLARTVIPKPRLPLDDEKAIHIFTAVAYSGMEKKGAWAAYLRFRDKTKNIGGNEVNTTANRMHILAAINGLKAIKKPWPIHIYTVSGYLKDGASQWAPKWSNSGWMTKEGNSVRHRDLWSELLRLFKSYKITWHMVSKENMPEEMARAKDLAKEGLNKGQTD